MASGDQVVVTINGNSQPLSNAVAQAQASLKQFQSTAQDSTNAFSKLSDAAGGFTSALQGVVGQMTSFINNALQIATGVGLYNFFDTALAKARDFGQEMFDLNNTMERYQTSWEYLFGTGDNASSRGIAQGMADWTKISSVNYPFTRQDMLGAINSAGMVTQDPKLIEQYMPTIADIASTRTNMAGQPVSLQEAMYALVQGNMGMSKMLKMDLKLDPGELQQKYGWTNSGDFQNLLESLKRYNVAHHLSSADAQDSGGAAQHIATSTWYGLSSSFEDRIQNFQLTAGQSMFGAMKNDLVGLSDWWTAHANDMDHLATVIGTDVGNAVKTLTEAGQQFAAGWEGGTGNAFTSLGNIAHSGIENLVGIFQAISQGFSNTGGAAAFSEVFQKLAQLGGNSQIGSIVTDLGKLLGMGAGASLEVINGIAGAIQKISSSKDALNAVIAVASPFAAFIADTLIGDFIAWAVAAWAAAAGTIAATWPILAVGAGIALLVFGIKELIDHWGQLTDWLGKVKDSLGKLKDQFTAWAGDLLGKFATWAGDMIQNFIDGIKNKLGDLKNTLGDAAGSITQFFGHSVPIAGPLVDELDWMPHMMTNFERGIRDNTPRLAAAMRDAAGVIQGNMGVNGGGIWGNSYASSVATNYAYGSTSLNIYNPTAAQVQSMIDASLSARDAQQNMQRRGSGPLRAAGVL